MSASQYLTAAEAKAEVEKFPQIGDVYEFDYYVNDMKYSTGRLMVVDVTDEHVMYKLFNDDGTITQRLPYPMTHEVWKANTDERRKVEPVPAPELQTLDLIICPICEAQHQSYEVKLLGSGIGNDKVNWSEWLCLFTGETWTHFEPVPAPEVTG